MATRDPQLAEAHRAARAGRLGAARELYQRVIRRRPRDAEAYAGLAMVLARAGDGAGAVARLRRAVALRPANAGYHHALAAQLAARGEHEAALASLEQARRLEPDRGAAHLDAATLLESMGRKAEAREAVGEVLRVWPRDPRANVLAIQLDLRGASGADTPDAQTLERWRDVLEGIAGDASDAGDAERAQALDILVDVCERLEDHDRAWDAITRCNETDRRLAGEALPSSVDRAAALEVIGSKAGFVTRERMARWREQRIDDGLPSPALLVGFPRSGTTMTERALDSHPALRSIEERYTFETLREGIGEVVPADVAELGYPAYLDALTRAQLGKLRRWYWQIAARELGLSGPPGAGEVVLDKLPLRINNLVFVARLFPEARVLVALRDPRDVVLSCVRQRFEYAGRPPLSFFLDPRDTVRLYVRTMETYLATREAYTNPMLEIRYERTVADFEARMREMLEFLGLAWDDRVLSFHERTDRFHNTPSYHAVTRRVSTGAVGRWHRYRRQLEPVLPALEPIVAALGYE